MHRPVAQHIIAMQEIAEANPHYASLMVRREIDKLRGQLDTKGLTLIPLNIHLKGSWIKLTIGLGKGRKLHDKRQEERRKQDQKDLRSALKRY